MKTTDKPDATAGGSLPRMVRPAGKTRTEADWAAYRCQLSCRIGRDALSGKSAPPRGTTALEYAVFNLLHAVEELSKIRPNDLAQAAPALNSTTK